MTAVHNQADSVPGLARLPFRDPNKKKRKITEENMSPDPLFFAMIERPELQCCFERPERPFHFHELLVAQGDVFRGQRIVRAREQVLAVERLFFLDFGLIDPEFAGLGLSDIPAHRPVGQQGADGLLMRSDLGIAQRQDRLCDPLQGFFPGCLIFFRLFRIIDEDETAASFSIADDNLLDLQVLSHFLVPTLERQGFLMSRLAVPQLLAQDVMPAGFLQNDPVRFARHPPVHDPDTTRKLPASKVRLHPLHRGHVRRVARKHPAAHRKPLLRHRQPDHDLRPVRPAVLRMTVPSEVVFFLAFRIGRCGIEEQKIHFQVEKISRGEKDFLLDRLFVFQKKIHRPVKMLQRDRLRIPQRDVLAHPLLDTPLGVGRQGPVGHHGEDRPLDRKTKVSLLKGLGQDRPEPQPLPEMPQEISASQGSALDEPKRRRRTLGFESIFGGDKPAEAADQSADGAEIQRVGSAEGVEDPGPGKAALGIADVMSELDIGGGGSVLVFAGDGPHVHAYSNIIYYHICQYFILHSHAYAVLTFLKYLC